MTQSPYDIMRAHVDQILEYDQELSSTTTEFTAVVDEQGGFHCDAPNRMTSLRQEICIFQRASPLTREVVLRLINEAERDDAEEQEQKERDGITDLSNWRNWDKQAKYLGSLGSRAGKSASPRGLQNRCRSCARIAISFGTSRSMPV
jgi:hypothetical protein